MHLSSGRICLCNYLRVLKYWQQSAVQALIYEGVWSYIYIKKTF